MFFMQCRIKDAPFQIDSHADAVSKTLITRKVFHYSLLVNIYDTVWMFVGLE